MQILHRLRFSSSILLLALLAGCASTPSSDWQPVQPAAASVVYTLGPDPGTTIAPGELVRLFNGPRYPAPFPQGARYVSFGRLKDGKLEAVRQLQRYIQSINEWTMLSERAYQIEVKTDASAAGRTMTLTPTTVRDFQKSIVGSWDIPDLTVEEVVEHLRHARIWARCRFHSSADAYTVHRRLQAAGPITTWTVAGALGERQARQDYEDAFGVPAPAHGYKEQMMLPVGSGGSLQPVQVLIAPQVDGSDVELVGLVEGVPQSDGTIDLRASRAVLEGRARQLLP